MERRHDGGLMDGNVAENFQSRLFDARRCAIARL